MPWRLVSTELFYTVELVKIWAEHQDADGDKVPVGKVVDIYWNVGYILGNEYSKKFEEELQETHGKCTLVAINEEDRAEI